MNGEVAVAVLAGLTVVAIAGAARGLWSWPRRRREDSLDKAVLGYLQGAMPSPAVIADILKGLSGAGARPSDAAIEESLLRLQERNQVEQLRSGDGWTVRASGPTPAKPADRSQALRTYFTAVKSEHGFIDIRGLQVGSGKAYRRAVCAA